MRDLGERVGLIHELRELRRSEEFADRGHYRLRIHQVVRHGRRHFLVDAHLLFDRALHAHQTNSELVLHQLANRAHAAIAEMVDVIHQADAAAQLEQVANGRVEVFRLKRAVIE